MKTIIALIICSLIIIGTSWVLKPKAEPVYTVEYKVPKWHWESEFTPDEKQMLTEWLSMIYKTTQSTIGPYEFDVHFYMHRSDSKSEPVPWANTTRGSIQGVHFHVNPDFEKLNFEDDWTAQHEISHLSIPFVGKENTWFSEGYASFMQYQVMRDQGVYSQSDIDERYMERFKRCKVNYQSDEPFPKVAEKLKKSWNYPDLYWGGATFFWRLDNHYKKEGSSLAQIIKRYQGVRKNDATLLELCQQLDKIAGDNYNSKLLKEYQTLPARTWFENF